tara:strand:- start:46 stop:345 length:300 start_codon:yes stop_codon:yes gene_type:complete
MELRRIGPNQTEITTGDRTVLYSYDTPVVVHVSGGGYFRTVKRHSVTTSKHINKYIGGATYTGVSQATIDGMADGAPINVAGADVVDTNGRTWVVGSIA